MKCCKNYLAFIIFLSLITPAVSKADYNDAVRIFDQIKSIEISAKDLIKSNASLRQSFTLLYQSVIDLLKEELQKLKKPETPKVVSEEKSLEVSYTPTPQEIASADIDRGSIASWSFDKYSNSCDTKGAALTNADGKVGSALGLSGSNSYCVVSNNRNLYPKDLTLALYAKSDPSYSDKWNDSGWFVSLRDRSGFNIGPVSDSRVVKFTLFDDTNLVQNAFVVGTVTPDNITDWHHYAMTYDGSIAKVYFDGILATTTNVSISRNYADNKDLYFGLDNDSFGQHLGIGTLDEIRIYNRALTTCEIQILAGRGCENKGNTASIFSGVKSIFSRLWRFMK